MLEISYERLLAPVSTKADKIRVTTLKVQRYLCHVKVKTRELPLHP